MKTFFAVLFVTITGVAAAQDRYPSAARVRWPDEPAQAVQQATHVESEPLRLRLDSGPKQMLSDNALRTDTPSSRSLRTFTMLGSLAIVLALFGAMAWLMRRSMPQSARLLPAQAVEVIGRTPLGPKDQMHVVRFANHLLLVCQSPEGVATLTELTDPTEVQRALALCTGRQIQKKETYEGAMPRPAHAREAADA